MSAYAYLDGKPEPRVASRFTVKVVGLSFRPGYPDSLLALSEALDALPAGTGGEASLIRDLDNEVDPHAVAVLVSGAIVGYIPATLARRVGPEIDAGSRFRVVSAEVLIHPEFPERPGLEIEVERIPTQGAEGAGGNTP